MFAGFSFVCFFVMECFGMHCIHCQGTISVQEFGVM